MKYRSGNEIRQLFLDFFASKGHMIEPGASLVPKNDPTLLWINAGVAALKKYFDGSEKPKSNRIANAQKSIRTNDIENVGKTARHHTFFEMLGNFSIGDYFKEEAIPFAWEFLTSEDYMGIPKEKLYISVYTDDTQAYEIWTQKVGVDPSHILKTEDNFWEIGEGPSGPDSEIFYDRGEKYDPQHLGEKLFFDEMENDRYIEVWNVVFSQYDAKPGIPRNQYKELPQKNIDTGMGLERLVSIIQDGETNFDTDLFLPIIHELEKMSKHPYDGEYKMAYRVIADHIRTITFALSDGAMFSNNGRGYVLRRVLRRAERYGIKLGLNEAFMYKLVPVVTENMKAFYPYLTEKVTFNQKLIKNEEDAFHKTLQNGEHLLEEALNESTSTKILNGKTVFKLYDTYGFPYELTKEIAEDAGYQINKAEFDAEMAAQKERARAARAGEQSMSSQSKDLMNFVSESKFIGYDNYTCEAKVIGLFKDGEAVDCLNETGEIIFDQTVFYAEMGGQVADFGSVECDGNFYNIIDVQKAPHGQFLHTVEVDGEVKVNDAVTLRIDDKRRELISRNHSATHLLQAALRATVGNHITQAGSFVNEDYLRFDFTHFEKLSRTQLDQIEIMVNDFISQSTNVNIAYLPIEEAKKSGATALFDEKYGDVVRVVTMGDISSEFCGGCHVKNTANIGMLKIVSEESIGSGVRRIVAKTGLAAFKEFKAEENKLVKIADALKLNSLNEVDVKVEEQIENNKHLEKTVNELNEKAMSARAENLVKEAQEVNGLNILVKKIENIEPSKLKEMALLLRGIIDYSVIFLANVTGDKVVFAAAATKGAVEKGINCGQLVKSAAQICEGNGGGKPDLAQAGGKNPNNINDAIDKISSNLGFKL